MSDPALKCYSKHAPIESVRVKTSKVKHYRRHKKAIKIRYNYLCIKRIENSEKVLSIMSNLQTNNSTRTGVIQSGMRSLANEVKVDHRKHPWIRDENNQFPHLEPSKSHHDIII